MTDLRTEIENTFTQLGSETDRMIVRLRKRLDEQREFTNGQKSKGKPQ